MYIRDANIIIIVYDLTSKVSYSHVQSWVKEVNEIKKTNSIIPQYSLGWNRLVKLKPIF